ncbi:hypothetical protein ATANTOWER_026893 [Ataeniobius toweri]|uniref:Uncharacterized protein n=1 Tax=Ataeniobius toweri TaxID=208326 RepID=A0ABU7B0Z9_9TELE|nr:hypothetical protein [Ataeniobius toweri]
MLLFPYSSVEGGLERVSTVWIPDPICSVLRQSGLWSLGRVCVCECVSVVCVCVGCVDNMKNLVKIRIQLTPCPNLTFSSQTPIIVQHLPKVAKPSLQPLTHNGLLFT